jgi:LPXTG-site transpeptidase (sortase) family protein
VTLIEAEARPHQQNSESNAQAAANSGWFSKSKDAEVGLTWYIAWVALIVLAGLLLSVTIGLTLVSRLQYRAAQAREFDRFRLEVAEGTAPVGQTTSTGHLLALGTPVALLEIPTIHLRSVVDEGTTGAVLMSGPGHRRDTPFPGQGGITSVVMGRAAAYGAPFAKLRDLKPGAVITVTTGEGTSRFKVRDVRRAGNPLPPPVAAGKGRLTLQTATGASFVPSGVLSVDADLISPTLPSAPTVIPVGSVPRAEQALGTDTSMLWVLIFWLEGLVLCSVGAVWSWHRWGRVQTWVVFVPLVALVGFFLSGQVARLLPNLM